VRPAVEAEKLGIPSVVVTLTNFVTVAQLAAKAAGVEHIRIAEYPGAIGVHLPEIRAKITNVLFEQIVSGLTKPAVNKQLTATTSWDAEEIVCRGSFENVNGFFKANEWTDGLPIVPPTLQRVEAFLHYTDLAPYEEVAILAQANRRAVPWNIAVNGVMAGCRPEDMPILIAAVEAMGDEHYNLNNIGTTWGIIPYLLINGPIIKQLGIEYAGQLISQGPNPALGRAVGLIIRNIGGYRPGKNQMGTFGYPLVFTLAENEDETPWEPYHVEHGFPPETSTVTVGATLNWGWPPSPYTRPDKSGAQTALELMCIEMTKKPCLPLFAERGPKGFPSEVAFLLAPSVAKTLADGGYSKQQIREYVYEHARVPRREFEWMMTYGLVDVQTVEGKVEAGLYPKEFLVGPDELVRVISSPDVIHLVVCGDPGRNRMKTLDSGYTRFTSRAIKLPAQWKRLLAAREA
jgi:hypothetical protein